MKYSSNKTIAKNTIFLYFRMTLIIIVGLYSSRVILNTLGVEDYGIYNVAGSVVAIFGFLNGALSTSSSRFLTFELGKQPNCFYKLQNCFKTTKSIHNILALFIIFICETIGLWILYYKCEIPIERINAAFWVFQISIITSVLAITLVPYSALLIAHEHMSIYAYIGIIDAIFKLLICFVITISPIDNLIFYAILIFIVQLIDNIFTRYYCKNKFQECVSGYCLNKDYFKPILNFTGWNLLGSFSFMIMNQAATILISMFFGPAIVTGRAIAGQVKNHIMNFINNFRTAVIPQIIKRHASEDYEGSKHLLFTSTNISFYLMLLLDFLLL